MKTCVSTLLAFISLLNIATADLPDYDKELYNDESVAELITVITATSPVLSIPNTTHLYPSQVSLYQIPALAKAKKIIVFDGLPPGKEHVKQAYDKYKAAVEELTQSDYYFLNTELVFCDEWGHLSGAITEALKQVTTPFVFMHQHDLVLQKKFDLNGVVATMMANPNIKYVHMWGAKNKGSEWWNNMIDEEVAGLHFVPLTRSFGWSDQCHIARVEYYQDFVLPECDHCFMESAMQKKFREDLKKVGEAAHAQFGTYLYGDLKDGHYIKHLDGRNRP